MQNIELKAHLRDRAHADSACMNLGATFQADIHQIDTYFDVPEGRLKLRENEPGERELIFYRRPDVAEAKASDYSIERVGPNMKALLADALGVVAVVDKVRSLWLWENVRIHLDRVQHLGEFIEFEAVLSESDTADEGHAKVALLQQRLALDDADLLHGSYVDLISAKGNPT